MRWLDRLFRKAAAEKQLDSELRFHLEQRVAENIAAGMSPEEARRRARIEFGGMEAVKEECREARGIHVIETLLQDVRYALRMVRKNPSLTAIAILTLAFGIGASTAIFGVIDALVLRKLPVHDPGQLVSFYATNQYGEWAGIRVSQLEEIERQQSIFSGVFGRQYPNNSNVETHGDIWPINLGEVTPGYYSVLGVNPRLGRLITPEDGGIVHGEPSTVAVLSYEFWQRRYAGSRDVIGKTILIANAPFTIIGVTPKGFFGEQVGFSLDVTIPITEAPGQAAGSQQSLKCQYAVGRLRDGVSLDQARAQLEAIWPGVRAAVLGPGLTVRQRDEMQVERLRVEAYPTNGFSYLRDQFSKPLYVLMGIAGLILLIACVNLATLLLARASARQHEMGVRLALGASRWRLMRQLLTESLVLSLSGAALGLGLAYWASEWLVKFWNHIPFNPPTAIDLKPDFRVVLFATSVAIATGILFGLAPALHASHGAPGGALQEGSRAGGRNVRHFGRLLIAAQVALSVVLIATGGLLVRSLEKLRAVRPGFDYRHVVVMQLQARAGGHKNFGDAYYQTLVRELSGLPGVGSAALSQMLPGAGFGGRETVEKSDGPNAVSADADSQVVSPEFFQTLNIAFVQGRGFTWQDDEHSPRVAVISKSLAKQLFPSGDSIGKSIRIGTEPERPTMQVVGVANDARVTDIRVSSFFAVYVPFLQQPEDMRYWTNVEILAAGQAGGILEAAEQRVDSLGRQFVFNSETLEEVIDTALANERATAFVSGFFAGLALLIAVIGLQGLISYKVTQRTREIGVRMALGAQPMDVLRMVMGEGALLAGIGIAAGIGGALVLGRLVESLLFGIKPNDPTTLVGVAMLLVIVALTACYIPARRAACVDPMVALRHE